MAHQTAAGLVYAISLFGLLAFAQVFDAEFRKDIPNVVRWYTTLVHFPNFNAVFVEKDLCKQRLKCKFLHVQ